MSYLHQPDRLIDSLAFDEMLVWLHTYTIDQNGEYAVQQLGLALKIYKHLDHGEPWTLLARYVERGNVTPPLDMPELSIESAGCPSSAGLEFARGDGPAGSLARGS